MSTKLEDLIDYDQENEYLTEDEEHFEDAPIVKKEPDMSKAVYSLVDIIYQKVKAPVLVLLLCLFFINPTVLGLFEKLEMNVFVINILTSILIALFFSIIREFI